LGVDRICFAIKFAATAVAIHHKKFYQHWAHTMHIKLGIFKKTHGCSMVWNKTLKMIQICCGWNSNMSIQIKEVSK
jgi:hypothetical protein